MLGNTNAIIGNAVQTEKINLTITSNQADSSDLIGVGFGIAYGFEGGYGETYTWEGKPITLDIPQYATYTISFSDVTGYKTSENIVFTAVPDNVRQITAEYQTEVVTVTITVDNGTSVVGQTVTINGVTTTLTSSSVVSQKIPYGTTYSVSVNSMNGYNSPTTQTFIASQQTRTVSMIYEEVMRGVFIQDITGKLWKESTWNDSVTANGVAVLTDDCEFVIASDESSILQADGSGTSSNMTLETHSTPSAAIRNFSGLSNTNVMVSVYGNDTGEAAGYCTNFTFPNGNNGYLGSAGEWHAVCDNIDTINRCILKINGNSMNKIRSYWTSTRGINTTSSSGSSTKRHSFFIVVNFNVLGNGIVLNYGYARPFTTL